MFTADSTKPPLRWPKVFAVCPASLPREAETALTAADASFRLVHPSCRVTAHWMDMCVKVNICCTAPVCYDCLSEGVLARL